MMVNKYFKLLIIAVSAAVSIILVTTCSPNDESAHEYERWTSSDPLAIPYRVRKQRFDQGNLIPNSSFESGRLIKYDSVTTSTNIDTWDIIGEQITWLSVKNDSTHAHSCQIHSGGGSVLIQKEDASETEEFGSGILSGYIKVIPGNYELTLYVNLINIRNIKSRLGTRLFDAVNIKILCYDRNKVQIKGDRYSPYFDRKFDNNFKASSLSRFAEIDSTGWLHIQAKTNEFPYHDGDLQDETKFVRIFIGLKGNGSMLVDDVNFRYTRNNFSAYELVKPYFDTTLTKQALIVPEPKHLEILGSLLYYRPYYEDNFPVILIPDNSSRITMQAAECLENRIKQLLVEHTELTADDIPTLIRFGIKPFELGGALVFSLGSTFLARKFAEYLPYEEIRNKQHAYFIHSISDQNNIVFLDANNSAGLKHAVQSCIQLFDRNKLVLHNVNVVDYPSINDYSVMLLNYSQEIRNYISDCSDQRFNSIYLPGTSELAMKELQSDNSLINKFIYFEDKKFTDQEIIDITHHNSSFIEGICLLHTSLEYPLLTNFGEIEQNLLPHNDINISNIAEELNGKVHVEVVPSYSDNYSLLNTINRSGCALVNNPIEDCKYMWGAYKYQTWKLDEADFGFFKGNAYTPEVFLDFTMLPKSKQFGFFGYDSLWASKLKMASLLEPFYNQVVPEIYEKFNKVVVAVHVSTVFDKVRLQTISDYLWYPEVYNPELSLFRAMIREYGVELSRDLFQFNDLYFKVKSEILLAREYNGANKFIRRAQSYMNELKVTGNAIINAGGDKNLIDLITNLMNELITLLEENTIVVPTG